MRKFIDWLISNKGMSWATALIVIAQGFHYYHLFIGIELFQSFKANVIYSVFLTIVLSLPLMIFTTKMGSIKRRKDKLREYNTKIELYRQAINWYTSVDIIINIYTWYNKLNVINGFELKSIPLYFVITMVAILLPITLKKFAGEIKF